MNPLLLLLLFGAGAAVLVRRRGAVAGGGAGGAGVPPPEGFIVTCPTEISPGNWSDWTQACDTQLYSGVELPVPAGFLTCTGIDPSGKTTTDCRILPDGTPLYEYAADGIPWDERGHVPVQTYFAGQALDKPSTAFPVWNTPGAWPARDHRDDITGSPAPFAWHDFSQGGGGQPSGPGYYPIQGVPYVPRPWLERSGLNDLKNFACSALKTGLTIGGPALEIVGKANPMPGASKLATSFYEKACGSN